MADWIGRLLAEWGYPAVAALMLLETVFPPLPSELIMPLAGLAADRGPMSLAGVTAAGTAGAMVGNYAWFLLARAAGEARLRRFVHRHGRWLTMSERDLDRAGRWFDRWGAGVVGVGRMVPTARSLVSVPAGLLGMGTGRFLLASTIGTAVWTGGLAWAGQALGERYQGVERWVEPVASGVLLLLLGAYLWRLIFSRRR